MVHRLKIVKQINVQVLNDHPTQFNQMKRNEDNLVGQLQRLKKCTTLHTIMFLALKSTARRIKPNSEKSSPEIDQRQCLV